MKNFGLSEKEIKQIINNVHPDGWLSSKDEASGKTVLTPSPEQLQAAKSHLETLYALDKRKEYLSQLVVRLKPEVENKNTAASTGEPA